MDFMITDIAQLSGTIKQFDLRPTENTPLPLWQAGAHVLLRFASKNGRAFENRYSLVGRPGKEDTYRIAVLREENGSGGSRCLHDEITIGAIVDVEGPYNSFPLVPAEGRVVLIGGGIGITPLVSMAHTLAKTGTSFIVHYLVRQRDSLVMVNELASLAHGFVLPHVSEEAGRADLDKLLGQYQVGDSIYACGPVTLLQQLLTIATSLGWPGHAVHFESFGSRAQDSDLALTVKLELSGITVQVEPGETILNALIGADAFVAYECKRGECGSCYTPVISGNPLHRDVCLTPAMRSKGMCTCVSWAAGSGPLVLEL